MKATSWSTSSWLLLLAVTIPSVLTQDDDSDGSSTATTALPPGVSPPTFTTGGERPLNDPNALPPGVSPPVFTTGGERPLNDPYALPPGIHPPVFNTGGDRPLVEERNLNKRSNLPPGIEPPEFTTGGSRPLVAPRSQTHQQYLFNIQDDTVHSSTSLSAKGCKFDERSLVQDSANCPQMSCNDLFADRRSCNAWQNQFGQVSSTSTSTRHASPAHGRERGSSSTFSSHIHALEQMLAHAHLRSDIAFIEDELRDLKIKAETGEFAQTPRQIRANSKSDNDVNDGRSHILSTRSLVDSNDASDRDTDSSSWQLDIDNEINEPKSSKSMDKCQRVLCLSVFLAELDCNACSVSPGSSSSKWRGDKMYKDDILNELYH